ncbi:MAG TPA: sugar ABC transporter permease [Chloroflexota bacterium]|jgi:multiple sugar transport system permease protein|nr:sugar ABC transporter permease [Chloroflexota bacterium]
MAAPEAITPKAMQRAPRLRVRGRARLSRQAWRENLEGWLFTAPFTLGFLCFTLGPFLASAVLALTDWSIVSSARFVGLANFREAFFGDPLVWHALRVTTVYAVVAVPLQIAFGFGLAMLLNTNVRGLEYYRTIYYLPAVLSGVAVALMWKWIFSGDWGILNLLLSYVGIEGPYWLNEPGWALPALIMVSLWHVGGAMVIYLAGLQGIPTDLYEAAAVDGAGFWPKLRHITIPMVTPVLFFQLVIGLIASLQTFTQALIMTNGGPENATLFYMLYLYRRAFVDFRMGFASAMAWILFVYILALTILVFRSGRTWVYYEGELKGRP